MTPTLPAGHPHADSEADVVAVSREIAAILDRGGFEVRPVAAEPPVGDRLVANLMGSGAAFEPVSAFPGGAGVPARPIGLISGVQGRPPQPEITPPAVPPTEKPRPGPT